MSDSNEIFKPQRPESNQMGSFSENNNPDVPKPKIDGNIPEAFLKALNQQKNTNQQNDTNQQKNTNQQATPANAQVSGSDHLKELITNLKINGRVYEEIQLPSRGKFYDGELSSGTIHIRPMTGEEEQILATPRFVKKGQAINMIFERCIQEKIKPQDLLSVDRTYLLIYLRGISYSPEYEVEIKCPECTKKFTTSIDLNSLHLDSCPDDFGPILADTLPNTKLTFTYRLGTGSDEQEIQDYRDRRIKMFGDGAADDTLTYRTAQLLVDIDGITNKNELQILLKNLPINDVSYIRSCVNEPPFGVDTNVEIICASCLQDFNVELPLESSFFFPRRKKATNTQV